MRSFSLLCSLCITILLAASSTFSSGGTRSSFRGMYFQRPCTPNDGVTVVDGVMVNNVVDGDDRRVTKAPVITLQGSKYLVEQRYTGGGAERTVFNRLARAGASLKDPWQGQAFLDTYGGDNSRNEKHELRRTDFPSGKCLITFWAFEEGIPLHRDEDGSRHREVPYSNCSVTGAGSNKVIELKFSDAYTTATVKVYRPRP